MPGTGTVLTMPGLIGGRLPLNTGTFHSVGPVGFTISGLMGGAAPRSL